MKHVKVAITGGVGSGKSEVLKCISSLGYKTVNFDNVYSELLEDENFVLRISNEMQVEPLIINGKVCLNREKLSKKVFSDPVLLKKLNFLTHKYIFDSAFSKYNEGLVFYEVPVLFEGGYQTLFDYVFVVVRDLNSRINALKLRDNSTEEQINRKINNQVNYESIDLSLHTVIENNSNLDDLKKNIKEAISKIEKKF
ncbi:MAG: dephospho-CoA kinase [Clostridia bacterium]|nr:dephospho-CoA kinase [Clostridia bacterium]